MARTTPRRWIGVDGEGLGRRPHRYVMICSSEGDAMTDRAGLSTRACLDWLVQLGGRDARVAGFFLSYDWTMILRDLPNRDLHALLRPELRELPSEEGGGWSRVHWGPYRLHYLSRAMWITRADGAHVTVWDIGQFYQAPFVVALRRWKVAGDTVASIERMKARRSTFTARDLPAMRRYCADECRALASLAGELEAAHHAAGIHPRAWHGPGSSASAVMSEHRIHKLRGDVLPLPVSDAVDRAYFGGRFEHSTSGQIGRVWAYDIASAYPAHATTLPCLVHGKWKWTEKEVDLVHARAAVVRGHIVDARGPWAPLPVRLADGSIRYPRAGASGWWWSSEWRAARRGWGDGVQFVGAWVLVQRCKCPPPFAWLADMYARRHAIGKNSGPGITMKLAMNSVAGKLAQSIGHGQYRSRTWSGMLMAGTRAQLLDLVCRHRDRSEVVAVATDGLYSTRRLDPGGPPTGQLGAWERDSHPGLVLVRPGIYWTGDGVVRARGIGRGELDAAKRRILAGQARGADAVRLPPREVFGAARAMVWLTRSGAYKRADRYGQWYALPSSVSLLPGPQRAPDWSTLDLRGVESCPYGRVGQSPDGETLELVGDLLDGAL